MVVKKRSITAEGFLKLLSDVGLTILPPGSRREARAILNGEVVVGRWDEYFPSVIVGASNRLLRKGLVEKEEMSDGVVVKITEKGKREILKFDLAKMAVKRGKWDGKWRIVFFDVDEDKRHIRDRLREYLKILGLKQMQESVFVSPFDVFAEVKYLREVLDIPHAVKLATVDYLENSEDLREIFEV